MAIAGTEWLILGALTLLAIIFLPNSMVDLGRGVGKAVGEFKSGKSQVSQLEHDGVLAETTEKLGIRTEGKKTPNRIIEEILARASRDTH